MTGTKRLPYGISDFTDLRRQGCYYADKTQYIPTIEAAGDFLLAQGLQNKARDSHEPRAFFTIIH